MGKVGSRKHILKLRGTVWSNDDQTLADRIRYLRANKHPYMTQRQLSQISGVPLVTIVKFECRDIANFDCRLSTLRRIARGLGCGLYVNIRPRSRRGAAPGGFLPVDHELPFPTRPKRIVRELDLKLAAKYGNSPWKKAAQKRQALLEKLTSDTPNSASEEPKAE